MDEMIKKYIEACKVAVTPFGFKRKGRSFYRVVNDVLQNISVEKISSGWACRVEFAITPLCRKIDKLDISRGLCSHYLKQFNPTFGIQNAHFDSWEYDRYSEESITACIKEIMRYITDYLLPFFEQANSCETALPELIKFEKFFNQKRHEELKKRGHEEKTESFTEFDIYDRSKYYMALKNGDYDYALKSRQEVLKQNLGAFNSMIERGYMTEEYRLQSEKDMDNLKDDIRLLKEKDFGYFQRLLKENEAYSRETLKGFLKQPIPETI